MRSGNLIGYLLLFSVLLSCEKRSEQVAKIIDIPVRPYFLQFAGTYSGTYFEKSTLPPYGSTTSCTKSITYDSLRPENFQLRFDGMVLKFTDSFSGYFPSWVRNSGFRFGKNGSFSAYLCQTPSQVTWYSWDLTKK